MSELCQGCGVEPFREHAPQCTYPVFRGWKHTDRGPRQLYIDFTTGKEAARPWPIQVGDYVDLDTPEGKREFLVTELDQPFGRALLVGDDGQIARPRRLFYWQWADDGETLTVEEKPSGPPDAGESGGGGS